MTSAPAAPPLWGGRVEQCDSCAHRVVAFNSCRNRHCPKCQSTARDRWLAKQARNCCRYPTATGVHRSEGPRSLGPAESTPVLCSLVSRHCRDAARDRCRSATSGGAHWLSCRASHLESELAASPACALLGAGRRTGPRRITMDPVPAEVLPARPGPELFVPEEAAGFSQRSFCPRKAAVQRAADRAR